VGSSSRVSLLTPLVLFVPIAVTARSVWWVGHGNVETVVIVVVFSANSFNSIEKTRESVSNLFGYEVTLYPS
jgi:hypothetical protein